MDISKNIIDLQAFIFKFRNILGRRRLWREWMSFPVVEREVVLRRAEDCRAQHVLENRWEL